jgi:hypothetical protein
MRQSSALTPVEAYIQKMIVAGEVDVVRRKTHLPPASRQNQYVNHYTNPI